MKNLNLDALEVAYYWPSDTNEYYDAKTDTFYNAFGQELRHPDSYRTASEGYTPFGDE